MNQNHGKNITHRNLSDESKNEYLSNIFYNIEDPDNHSSLNKLFIRSRQDKKFITREFIKNWLKKQEIYNLFKYPKRRKIRSAFVSSEIDRFWMTDLMDMMKFSKYNSGIKYLLVAIDVLSKYLWIEPLMNKKPESIKKALIKIFSKGRICGTLISDAGTEFTNRIINQFLITKNIKHFIMRNTEIKASIAERVIRTIKEKIQKIMFLNNDKNYSKFLDKIVENYNKTIHSRTGFKPINVTKKNEWKVFLNLFSRRIPNESVTFDINDEVRLLKLKTKFEKGYTNSWTKEIFKISKILRTLPFPRYKIKDSNNEELIGSFYSFELQRI